MTTKAISDIHAGPGVSASEWQTALGIQELTVGLSTLAEGDLLIIAGDAFDFQTVPHTLHPGLPGDMLYSGPARMLMETLQTLGSRGIDINYYPGNHDAAMETQDIQCPGLHIMLGHPSGPMWIQHGHEYSMFNAYNPNGLNNRPFGYYVSRLAASGLHQRLYDIIRALCLSFREHLTIERTIVDYIESALHLAKDDVILMPHGETDVTLGALGGWADYHGHTCNVENLSNIAEDSYLEFKAEAISCDNPEVSTIIMGHTHTARDIHLPPFHTRYVNTGSCLPGSLHITEIEP